PFVHNAVLHTCGNREGIVSMNGKILWTMRHGHYWLLLCMVLAIASFFRFYDLWTTPPGLYLDEAMEGSNAHYAAQTGQYKVYAPEDNGGEGLYANILALAFRWRLLPDNDAWSVRMPAAVAGVLTVLGLYFLVGELFAGRRLLALLSAFFLATSFW